MTRLYPPEELYETPPEWGSESHYLAREGAEQAARSLRAMGGDWQSVSIVDCRVWRLSRAGWAMYGLNRHDHQDARFWVPRAPLTQFCQDLQGDWRPADGA